MSAALGALRTGRGADELQPLDVNDLAARFAVRFDFEALLCLRARDHQAAPYFSAGADPSPQVVTNAPRHVADEHPSVKFQHPATQLTL